MPRGIDIHVSVTAVRKNGAQVLQWQSGASNLATPLTVLLSKWQCLPGRCRARPGGPQPRSFFASKCACPSARFPAARGRRIFD